MAFVEFVNSTPIRRMPNGNSNDLLNSTIPCTKGASGGTSIRVKSRVAQLQRLEDMMTSIESSLSVAPKKKGSRSVHSDAGSSSSVHAIGSANKHAAACAGGKSNRHRLLQNYRHYKTNKSPNNHYPAFFSDKESIILNSEPESSNFRIKYINVAEEKLSHLKLEMDNKKSLIKNLKVDLEKIDISTDDIDIKIHQAEIEQQIAQEEINLLSMLGEAQKLIVQSENYNNNSNNPKSFVLSRKKIPSTIFSCIQGQIATLRTVQTIYNQKFPQFGIAKDDHKWAYIEWCSEKSGLMKGDRLLEINGKLVLPVESLEGISKLLQSQNVIQIVIIRNITNIYGGYHVHGRRHDTIHNKYPDDKRLHVKDSSYCYSNVKRSTFA